MKKGRWALRAVARLMLTAGIVAGAAQVPAATWTRLCERTALAAVELGQPNTVAVKAGTGQRTPAGATAGTVTDPTAAPLAGAEQTPLPEITLPEACAGLPIPEENGTGGKIVEQRLGGGSTVAGIQVKNKNNLTVDLEAALASALPAVTPGLAEPQVLIYHTHTTEGYMPYDAGYFNEGDVRRAPDYPYNVTVVGDALTAELTAAGIGVIHDKTVYDYPSYRGAYERSVVMMEETVNRHPSVKVTIDLHRDGLMANSTDKLKPTATVEGQKAAQMMVVCGVLSTDSLPHPNWRQNLAFAARLQHEMETRYSGLMRPLSLVGSRYNQYVTGGSLLIEVGSEGNTLEEAVYSARLLGRTLAEMFKEETS